MASSLRYCLGCGFHLAPGIDDRCPECGRPFDRNDQRTTSPNPKGHAFWFGLRTLTLLGSGALGVLGLLTFLWLFVGGDVLFAFILGLPILALVAPAVLILTAIPRVPLSRRARTLAVLAVLFFGAVVAPLPAGVDWPLRLSFAVHRSSLDAFADQLEAVPTKALAGRGERIGLFSFKRVARHRGNLGLQVSGHAGGGQFLVRRGPESDHVWFNTNWEVDLGGNWWFVYQD